MQDPLRARTPQSFTLIELLVVIAIIAVLAALLVPSLKKALEMGRRSMCLANLHGIAVAVNLYAKDHDGAIPEARIGPSSIGWRWAGNVTYVYGHADDRPERPLNPYLNISQTVMVPIEGIRPPDVASPTRCPSDTLQVPFPGGNYMNPGTSYYYNQTFDHRSWGLQGITISEVIRPSHVVAASDYAVVYGLSLFETRIANPDWLGPHEPGTAWANAAFVDGHAGWVHFGETIGGGIEGEGWTMVP